MQDVWLRLYSHDFSTLDDPEAWLVTVTTQLALDRLPRAKTEREHHAGPWLPEPLEPEAESPEAEHERGESISLSFLLLLERLSPDERAAFLLKEVFDYSHAEVAAILGIGEDACRQRVHRAKTRLREGRRRLRGAGRLARLYRQIAINSHDLTPRYELAMLNGAPELFIWQGEALTSAMWIECEGERITAIHALRNPKKLARILAVTNSMVPASLH